MEMATIKIHEEAMNIVKSGLAIEENILKMSLDECKKDLETFERKYKMSSEVSVRLQSVRTREKEAKAHRRDTNMT
jgi:hypothetical protein